MGTKAVAKVTLVVNSGPKKNEQVHQSAKNSESCDDEFFLSTTHSTGMGLFVVAFVVSGTE